MFFTIVLTYLLQGFSNNDVIMVMPIFWIIMGLALANQENRRHNDNALYVKGPQFYGVGAVLFGLIIVIAVYLNYPSYGTVFLPGGEKYTGEFRGSTFHGHGTYETLGAVYTGDFRYGRFDGEGKMTFYNGSFYEGEFSKGFLNGKGRMHFADGREMVGIWKNGVYQE